MKILLISNSYIETTIINILDYILPYDISEIILMEENHSTNDIINCEHNIIICKNLFEAIKKCNIVLLFKTEYMHVELEKKLKEICGAANKNFVSFDLNIPIERCYTTEIKEEFNCEEKPVITILSLGSFNQHLYLEILINRIFREMGVIVTQSFSRDAENILQQTNPGCFFVNSTKAEVFIKCVECGDIESILQNKELLSIFEKSNSDFTIINIESGLNEKCDVNELIKKIEYRYNINCDLIVSSNYCSINDKKNKYIPLSYNDKMFLSVNDFDLGNIIKEKILDKITFPKKIIIKR